ncbi:MAG TPA: peptidoglycan-binding domain-containing protein, partial [Planctomycetota bacterium]|nr:peptidoglycan-binding domain-containing protein [Planctomycetota bacterium]
MSGTIGGAGRAGGISTSGAAAAGADTVADAGRLESGQLAGDPTLAQVAAGAQTLASGSRGPAVRRVQEALAALHQPVAADGAFGPRTKAAVEAVQEVAGLPRTGVLDAATLRALDVRLVTERDPYDDPAPAPPAGTTAPGPAAPLPAPAGPR